MSAFSAAMARGLGHIYDRIGEAAVYLPGEAGEVECTVVADRDITRYGDVLDITAQSVVISVRRSDIPNRPRRGEAFSLAGGDEVYLVSSILTSDELEHRIVAG